MNWEKIDRSPSRFVPRLPDATLRPRTGGPLRVWILELDSDGGLDIEFASG